jgi:hypothetical protein
LDELAVAGRRGKGVSRRALKQRRDLGAGRGAGEERRKRKEKKEKGNRKMRKGKREKGKKGERKERRVRKF